MDELSNITGQTSDAVTATADPSAEASKSASGARGPYLKIFGPDSGAFEYDLPQGTVIIGRSDKANIQFSHNTVSRIHASITYGEGGYVIQDANSNYGVIVNGKRVDRHVLHDGDSIQISVYVLEFHVQDSFGDAAAAAAQAKRLLHSDYCLLPSTMKVQYRVFKCNPKEIFRSGDTLPVGRGGLLIASDTPPEDGVCMEVNLTWPNHKDKCYLGEILGSIPTGSRNWICVKLHVVPKELRESVVAAGNPGEWIETRMR